MKPLSPDEITLIENAQKGKDGFEQLVRRYQHDVFRILRLYTQNDSDAEDLAQETWLKVYQSIRTLKDPHRFPSWLKTIAANTAKDWLSSRIYRNSQETGRIEGETDEVEPQQLEGAAISEYQRQKRIEKVRDAIDSLSEKNREVVYDFYILGYSRAQISQRLNIPESTVKSRLDEARNQLRKEFATMVAMSRIQEKFAPEHFIQNVMNRVGSLSAPVPKGSIIETIGRLFPTNVRPIIGRALLITMMIGVISIIGNLLLSGNGVQKGNPIFGGIGRRNVKPAQLENTKISFFSTRDGNQEIYMMNPDGTNQTRLTNNLANESDTSWSPDGTKIAFTSYRDGNGEIYVMNSDGTNQVNLTNNPALDYYPAWSPDGARIAFVSTRDGNHEIYLMNPDGTNPVNLTNHAALDYAPAWSPDGMKITFVSERDDSNGEIYVMNQDGTNVTRLTNNTALDYDPSWSPDGTKIAFMSNRSGNDEVYVMNSDGTNPVNLTNHPALDGDPYWSPDGTKIAFESTRDGNNEIYVMNPDGTSQVNLTNHPAPDRYPSWSPFLPATGTIMGRVTDKGTGSPIPQALVIALQRPTRFKTKTDADGSYAIKNLSPGTWQVLCWKRGYKFTLQTVTLGAGDTRTVDFAIERKTTGGNDIPPEFRAIVNAAPALSPQQKFTTTWAAMKNLLRKQR